MTTQQHSTAAAQRRISPALEQRIDALAGCQGHWVLIWDGVPDTDPSSAWHQSPERHLATCLEQRWRGVSLGFVPTYCGYSDYNTTGLVGLANYNCMMDPATTPDPHGAVLRVGYGWNGAGVVLDVLRVTAEMVEMVEALEQYPLISEDEHSDLEVAGLQKLWGDESVADRVRMLQDAGCCIFAARRDGAIWDDALDRVRNSLLAYLNSYPTICA